MTVFDKVARPLILGASRSQRLRHIAEQLPVTRSVVDRFIAGETVPEALDTVVTLRDSERLVTIDYLGEDTTDVDGAEQTVQAYLALLDGLRGPDEADAAVRPLEVALKLSALGQALPRGGVRSSLPAVSSIARDLRVEFDWLGTVLQAYLKRTQTDCEEFAAAGARIRLCKGAYDEPASVAYRDAADVTASYLRCLRVLMAGSGYPMVASHDPAIIDAVPALTREFRRGVDDFEYQMLYSIRDAEQRRLADAGNHVRVYVPFGYEWYGYFVRRLAERPANLTFFLRALVERS